MDSSVINYQDSEGNKDFNLSSHTITKTAKRLYTLGFNVFPVPNPKEVLTVTRNTKGKNTLTKPPYILKPLFFNRLHLCGETCPKYQKSKKYCTPPRYSFEELFFDNITGKVSNIGVMLGKTSGNLVVLDCDSQSAFTSVQILVKEKNIPHWIYSSSRGGGVMFRISEGIAKNSKTSVINDVEIYGTDHYIVIPPSLHSSGVFYSWIYPKVISDETENLIPVSIRELKDFGVELYSDSRNPIRLSTKNTLSKYPSWVKKLSQKNQLFLENGVQQGERNSSFFAAACDMAGNGIPVDDAISALLEVCEICQPPFTKQEALMTINSAYDKERKPSIGNNPALDFLLAEKFAHVFNWRSLGTYSNSPKAVFLAMVKRASCESSQSFRCSLRELSEMTQLSIKTVGKMIKVLCIGTCSESSNEINQPLIFVDHTDSSMSVNYYRFNMEYIKGADLPQYSSLDSYVVNRHFLSQNKDIEKDTFKFLRNTAWQVWKYLIENPANSYKEISTRLGISINMVKKALGKNSKLVKFGFVEISSGKYKYTGMQLSEEMLQSILNKNGFLGVTKKKKENHRIEREVFINYKIYKAKNAFTSKNS